MATPEELWKKSGLRGSYEICQFGTDDDANTLAQLICDGSKTATSSAYALYEIEGQAVPEIGTYTVICDARGSAVCITQTTRVTMLPFCEVPESHAYKEGEGDCSLQYWRHMHMQFFTDELREAGLDFDDSMLVVCEEFRRVW